MEFFIITLCFHIFFYFPLLEGRIILFSVLRASKSPCLAPDGGGSLDLPLPQPPPTSFLVLVHLRAELLTFLTKLPLALWSSEILLLLVESDKDAPALSLPLNYSDKSLLLRRVCSPC